MKYIAYRSGYKYQLAVDYSCQIGICPPVGVANDYIALGSDGVLLIRAGYAWDGPSGPTFDTPSSMRGSLVHDAGYQLLREELLDQGYREQFDQLLYTTVVEDGMWTWRARLWLREVRKFAAGAADPKHRKPVLLAPR
jgi:hypothetical protein